uniref:Ig-like domain-containing protein n=1 Tax=Sinocyclocheilus rhinocerous TaxID=307959 RepID=A0A673M3L2_9TELE
VRVLFFCTGNSFGDTIQPWFPEKHDSDGENVTLSCNYSLTSGTNANIQWYRQYPGAKPEFLLLVTEYFSKSEPELRLYSEATKEIKRVDLVIFSAAVSDSALYYCALRPTVTGNSINTVQNPSILSRTKSSETA